MSDTSRPTFLFPLSALLLGSLACQGGTCLREAAEVLASDSGVTAALAGDVWWAASGYSIAEVDIDGDGVLDLVGLCADRPGSEGSLYVGAFDGKTFEPRWRSASVGDQANAYLVQLGVAAGRVAVADPLGSLHVLDLTSGKEVARVPLTDRADVICAPREAPGRHWIATKDRTESSFDPRTLALVPAPRPASCPPGRFAVTVDLALCTALPPDVAGSMGECTGSGAPPPIPGFIGMEMAVDGADGVVAGMKSPGSSVPMIAGFTPGAAGKAPRLRWQRGAAPGSPLDAKEMSPSRPGLAAGRAIVTYEDLHGAHHLEAIDAPTGRTLWDTTSESFLQFRTTATRIYVMRWSRLDVRDAATGALLGGVGAR